MAVVDPLLEVLKFFKELPCICDRKASKDSSKPGSRILILDSEDGKTLKPSRIVFCVHEGIALGAFRTAS